MFWQLLRYLFLAILWALGITSTHAEGNCPDGYYPIGGPAVAGCAPIPGYADHLGPTEQWERRWGAIATDGPKGAMGVATDMRSKREASQMAMRDCQSNGGVNCKIDVTYDNQCAVVVVSDVGYNVPNAPTVDEAVAMGMKTCRYAGGTNCQVYYSACSPPARVR